MAAAGRLPATRSARSGKAGPKPRSEREKGLRLESWIGPVGRRRARGRRRGTADWVGASLIQVAETSSLVYTERARKAITSQVGSLRGAVDGAVVPGLVACADGRLLRPAMTWFASARERRLWLWTLAVVVAIYATLGLTGTLAGALREYGLLDASIWVLFAMFLVGATIVTQGIKARPHGAEIAILLGVTAVYLLLFLRSTALPEERTHLMEYGVLGVLIHEALAERASQGRRVPLPPVLAVLATAVLGVFDECIQWFLPNRAFDPQDILFNLLAGTVAVGASLALTSARRRASSRQPRREVTSIGWSGSSVLLTESQGAAGAV